MTASTPPAASATHPAAASLTPPARPAARTPPATPSARARRERRAWRQATAARLAAEHGGVVHRRELAHRGITRHEVRAEVGAGRWRAAGRHTIVVGWAEPKGLGSWWWAIWETGSGAVLDGASALLASGLTGFTPNVIDVCLPDNAHSKALPGVRVRRRRSIERARGGGIPRTVVEVATIRAAQLAVSDRQAALLICMPIQQRLTSPARLLDAWAGVRYSPRRALLDAVIGDVCDGVHSMGELDFARMCRLRGIPEPVRQAVRRGDSGRVGDEARGSAGVAGGRIYLDAEFAGGLVVEIDGVQHRAGLNEVDDALRANAVTLSRGRVLRIPVLGLRLQPDAFLDQVARALEDG